MVRLVSLAARLPPCLESISNSRRASNFTRAQSTLAQPLHNAGKSTLQALVSSFDAPVEYAFGYGSGVFSQGLGQRNANTQIDLIMGVQEPSKWHAINIEQNPSHYSGLRHLGSSAVAWVQQNLGAGVYFNPFVEILGHKVKYGVVSLDVLQRDLLDWRSLYLAGRMHKPVRILRHNDAIDKAQAANLNAALSVALLLLPEKFSERDLYLKLAGVSYLGDVRMALAENPRKVRNIVDNQFALFRRLYHPIAHARNLDIESSGHVGPDAKGASLRQSGSREDRLQLLDFLPKNFRHQLPDSIVDDPKARSKIAAAVAMTVKGPSLTQSAKGLLTAGISRSAMYSLEKLRKRWL